MLVKNVENREQLEFVSLEEMVPGDHLLRKIDAAIDFKKIFSFVRCCLKCQYFGILAHDEKTKNMG